jgi:hypothetical protein
MRTGKRMGRPPGRDYPIAKQIRLGTDDAERLALLTRAWECSESAAIRRAILLATEQDLDARCYAAAEQLADYYATDPEVQEWVNADFGTLEFLGEPDPDLAINHPSTLGAQGNGAAPAPETAGKRTAATTQPVDTPVGGE